MNQRHLKQKKSTRQAGKQTISLKIPKQLTLLCELLETTPEQVLQNFIDDVSLEVGSSGSDERRMAAEYFMRVCYGMHRYNNDDVEAMFDGLNWLRWQWPGNDPEKERQYQQQRTTFLKQWFKDWKAKQKQAG